MNPLSQPWEIAATKELVDILQSLVHGQFTSPSDLTDRLRSSAEAIELVLTKSEDPDLPMPFTRYGDFCEEFAGNHRVCQPQPQPIA